MSSLRGQGGKRTGRGSLAFDRSSKGWEGKGGLNERTRGGEESHNSTCVKELLKGGGGVEKGEVAFFSSKGKGYEGGGGTRKEDDKPEGDLERKSNDKKEEIKNVNAKKRGKDEGRGGRAGKSGQEGVTAVRHFSCGGVNQGLEGGGGKKVGLNEKKGQKREKALFNRILLPNRGKRGQN